jgi:hypothetical protein
MAPSATRAVKPLDRVVEQFGGDLVLQAEQGERASSKRGSSHADDRQAAERLFRLARPIV